MPVDLQHLQCVQQMDLHLRSSCLELAPTGECTYCSRLHRMVSTYSMKISIHQIRIVLMIHAWTWNKWYQLWKHFR